MRRARARDRVADVGRASGTSGARRARAWTVMCASIAGAMMLPSTLALDARVWDAFERARTSAVFIASRALGLERACGRRGGFCVDDWCARSRRAVGARVRGQEAAIELALDATCDHVEHGYYDRGKPLVIAAHGSPGVGKSTFHRSLARAAYNASDEEETGAGRGGACPGSACPGYKVIFGTDYVVREREEQARMLRDAVTRHLERFPESVVVVEEYDKLGCPARGTLKQMLEHGSAGATENPFDRNVTFARSIFILEANTGFMDVHDASAARGRAPRGDELLALQRKLRDGLFEKWSTDRCEDREDTLKIVGAIDVFVPFVPLDRAAVKSIVHSQLERRGRAKKLRGELGRLEWDDTVLERLVQEVEFEGEYAIEGGKEVSIVLSRCVTRALRLLAEREIDRAGTDGVGAPARALRDRIVRLQVSSKPNDGPVVAVIVE